MGVSSKGGPRHHGLADQIEPPQHGARGHDLVALARRDGGAEEPPRARGRVDHFHLATAQFLAVDSEETWCGVSPFRAVFRGNLPDFPMNPPW